jgi:integrase
MNNDLEGYRSYLEAHYQKKNTIQRYYDAAKRLLQHTQEINQQTIQHYIADLYKNYHRNTIVSQIIGLNKYLDYINQSDQRVKTPQWKRKQRDVASYQEIQTIIQYVKDHRSHQDYLIVLFIRDLCTRPHEITKARWDWIQGDKILFRDCKTGDFTKYLTKDLIDALEYWRIITPYPDNPFIFHVEDHQYKGKKLSDRGNVVREVIKDASRNAIGRSLLPQDLRASVITEEWNNYVNPEVIKRKAGHRSMQTTMGYNNSSEQSYREYIQTGTIFSNNPVLLPQKKQRDSNKPYDINTLPDAPQGVFLQDEGDNTSVSLSYSLVFEDSLIRDRFSPAPPLLFSSRLFLSPDMLSAVGSTSFLHSPQNPAALSSLLLSDRMDAHEIQTRNTELFNTKMRTADRHW